MERLLASSAHFRLTHEYETVYLERPGRKPVIVGDFYRDPAGAIIDREERWCLMVGAGLILYWLRPPFKPYRYDRVTPQWRELHRDPPEIWWIEAATQVERDRVVFEVDPASSLAGRYELDVNTFSIRKLAQPAQPEDL